MAFLKRIWPYCDMSKTAIIDLWILCLANNGHVSLLMDHVQNQTTGCPITFIELWLTAKTYLLSLGGFFLWLTFLSQCYFDKYLGLKYILTLPFAFKPFKIWILSQKFAMYTVKGVKKKESILFVSLLLILPKICSKFECMKFILLKKIYFNIRNQWKWNSESEWELKCTVIVISNVKVKGISGSTNMIED